MALFNPNFKWTYGTSPMYGNNYSPESGAGDVGANYAGAFSGVPGLTAAVGGDGKYTLWREGKGDDRWRADATVGDKNAVSVGDWKYDPVTSDAQMAMQAAALAAAAYGGLSAGGFLGGAGAGAGAGLATEAAGGLGITEAGLAGMTEGAAGVSGLSTGGGLSGMTAGTAASGGLLNGIGGKALDFAAKNPRMVAGLLGGLSGGAGGGDTGGGYTGPMPTISQGQWKPTVQQQSMPLTDVSTLTKMPKKGFQNSGLFRFMG